MSSNDTAAAAPSAVRVLVEGEEVLFDHHDVTGTGTVRLSGSASDHIQVR